MIYYFLIAFTAQNIRAQIASPPIPSIQNDCSLPLSINFFARPENQHLTFHDLTPAYCDSNTGFRYRDSLVVPIHFHNIVFTTDWHLLVSWGDPYYKDHGRYSIVDINGKAVGSEIRWVYLPNGAYNVPWYFLTETDTKPSVIEVRNKKGEAFETFARGSKVTSAGQLISAWQSDSTYRFFLVASRRYLPYTSDFPAAVRLTPMHQAVDTTAKVPFTYDHHDEIGHIYISSGDSTVVLDGEGEFINSIPYQRVRPIVRTTNRYDEDTNPALVGYYANHESGGLMFLNADFQPQFRLPEGTYLYGRYGSNGFYLVQKDKRFYGVINGEGAVVIPLKYARPKWLRAEARVSFTDFKETVYYDLEGRRLKPKE